MAPDKYSRVPVYFGNWTMRDLCGVETGRTLRPSESCLQQRRLLTRTSRCMAHRNAGFRASATVTSTKEVVFAPTSVGLLRKNPKGDFKPHEQRKSPFNFGANLFNIERIMF